MDISTGILRLHTRLDLLGLIDPRSGLLMAR